jgi:hypothetical protein
MSEGLGQYQKPPRFTEIKNNLNGSQRSFWGFIAVTVYVLLTAVLIAFTMDTIIVGFTTIKDWYWSASLFLAGLLVWQALITASFVWMMKE